jgi:hypothetical protein
MTERQSDDDAGRTKRLAIGRPTYDRIHATADVESTGPYAGIEVDDTDGERVTGDRPESRSVASGQLYSVGKPTRTVIHVRDSAHASQEPDR